MTELGIVNDVSEEALKKAFSPIVVTALPNVSETRLLVRVGPVGVTSKANAELPIDVTPDPTVIVSRLLLL